MSKWRYTNHINLSRGPVAPEDDPCIVTCPQCDREQDGDECFLGRLGWLTHYRCRYCGMGFSIAPERMPNV